MTIEIKFVARCLKYRKDPAWPRGRVCVDMKVYAVARDKRTGKILASKRLTKATANKVADFT